LEETRIVLGREGKTERVLPPQLGGDERGPNIEGSGEAEERERTLPRLGKDDSFVEQSEKIFQ
jgi:hypothetical protein